MQVARHKAWQPLQCVSYNQWLSSKYNQSNLEGSCAQTIMLSRFILPAKKYLVTHTICDWYPAHLCWTGNCQALFSDYKIGSRIPVSDCFCQQWPLPLSTLYFLVLPLSTGYQGSCVWDVRCASYSWSPGLWYGMGRLSHPGQRLLKQRNTRKYVKNSVDLLMEKNFKFS